MKVSEVFQDHGYPESTYVERRDGDKEEQLVDYLFKESAIVSISGPSKSGKSALVKHVTRKYEKVPSNLVPIRGNNISEGDNIWKKALEKLGEATKKIKEERDRSSTRRRFGISSTLKTIVGDYIKTSTEEDVEVYIKEQDLGLDTLIKIHEEEPFVIFIDDAHKIPDNLHKNVAEQIKEAFDKRLLVCLAYIDYRSDALVAADIDLSSRVDSISLNQWSKEELREIARKGFKKLKINVPQNVQSIFAAESVGSPQLMQKLCYTLCVNCDIYYRQDEEITVNVDKEAILSVLTKVAKGTGENYSTAYDLISGGTKSNTTVTYDYIDGESGDRYATVLRGIIVDESETSLSLKKLRHRINRQCVGKSPQSGNITQDVKRMSDWVDDSKRVDNFIFDYEEDQQKQVKIPEPALILYLRWSDVLEYEPEIF